jgi:hypothetical protein
MALDHAMEQQPFAKLVLFDHRPWDEGIGSFACEIGGRVAEETVPVGVHFEHPGSGDEGERTPFFGIFLFEAVVGKGWSTTASTPTSASASAASISVVAAAVATPGATSPLVVASTSAATATSSATATATAGAASSVATTAATSSATTATAIAAPAATTFIPLTHLHTDPYAKTRNR